MTQINLPFQVGQIVEVKSFIKGYRGAWFRCKIMDMTNDNGELRYKFKYLDFPDEPLDNALVFETPKGGTESQLMLRPTYPPHYHESEYVNLDGDVEPLVVVHDSWKVGDLVDWLKDEIYWSGEIVAMKGRRSCQIELLPKPEGEGKVYQGLCKNLRPRLDWSVEDGWKVPCTVDGQKCAKIVTSKNEDEGIADDCETAKEQTKKATKQVGGNEGLRLNIMESESIEAAVMDIEELIVRLDWLKGKLKPDVGEGAKPYWKYEDYRPSSSGR
ncbi:Agenet domain plant type [Arabidopsis thaliana x Arabidopsis arenosa]|uniref:Agenet domain plant type n=2 Tax=Arabidopsis thaliana x Arabidopsis arenosa TaxID=1240361 RepID=A0A8T1XI81_9BRAS|nr:Agenet domain plant type [Arabidopsis thaliana x Arabidopsis arenosa]